MADLLMWRLCSNSSGSGSVVRPSLGGLLGSILLQRVPQHRMRVRVSALWAEWLRGTAVQRWWSAR
jgi:hypothetical protein